MHNLKTILLYFCGIPLCKSFVSNHVRYSSNNNAMILIFCQQVSIKRNCHYVALKKLHVFLHVFCYFRYEVVQLKKTLSDMLSHAGLDDDDFRLDGPTQVRSLLFRANTLESNSFLLFNLSGSFNRCDE